jgi:IS5 family transposase
MHRARERLVRLAQKHGVMLRQSYVRVGKVALIQHQRYAHAKQFKRANKALRRVRTLLGRTIRDIGRKIASRPELADVFARPLSLARRVKDQRQRERGRKVYSGSRHRTGEIARLAARTGNIGPLMCRLPREPV